MKRIKKILVKKKKGEGDFFVSAVAIFSLTLVTFLYLSALADVQIRIGLDQVARKYILIMETEGGLSSSNYTSLKSEAKAVSKYITDVSVDYTNGSGYGTPVSLKLTCKAKTTNIVGSQNQTIKPDRSGTSTYTVRKQSTAKY